MNDDEIVHQIISGAYDAALDSSRWLNVLELTARFVEGSSASFFTRDRVNRTGDSNFYVGVEPHYKQLYFERYMDLDPLSTAYFFLNVGEVASSSTIIPHEEFLDSRFYREWAGPQGVIDNVVTLLDKSPTSVAGFVVFRHERNGLADEAARDRMRLITPHVRRAALIGRAVEIKSSEVADLADALDSVASGMILVDSQGRVVHANSAGLEILAAADVLYTLAGRLMATDSEANRALGAIFSLSGGGDAAVGTRGIAIPLAARDGGRYLAHVLPLTSGARRQAGVGFSAVAAVFVRKAELEPPPVPEVIAKLYGLTPSELRVLLALVERGGAADIAETLGIAEATARTHLRRLFDKTGARRQADLVKLVAGFTPPT